MAFRLKHSFYVHNLDAGWDQSPWSLAFQKHEPSFIVFLAGHTLLHTIASPLATCRKLCVLPGTHRLSKAGFCHSIKSNFLLKRKMTNVMVALLWV